MFQSGGEINLSSNTGTTALHIATKVIMWNPVCTVFIALFIDHVMCMFQANKLSEASTLLDLGADVTAHDDQGRTALHLSAAAGQVKPDAAPLRARILLDLCICRVLPSSSLWIRVQTSTPRLTHTYDPLAPPHCLRGDAGTDVIGSHRADSVPCRCSCRLH